MNSSVDIGEIEQLSNCNKTMHLLCLIYFKSLYYAKNMGSALKQLVLFFNHSGKQNMKAQQINELLMYFATQQLLCISVVKCFTNFMQAVCWNLFLWTQFSYRNWIAKMCANLGRPKKEVKSLKNTQRELVISPFLHFLIYEANSQLPKLSL